MFASVLIEASFWLIINANARNFENGPKFFVPALQMTIWCLNSDLRTSVNFGQVYLNTSMFRSICFWWPVFSINWIFIWLVEPDTIDWPRKFYRRQNLIEIYKYIWIENLSFLFHRKIFFFLYFVLKIRRRSELLTRSLNFNWKLAIVQLLEIKKKSSFCLLAI